MHAQHVGTCVNLFLVIVLSAALGGTETFVWVGTSMSGLLTWIGQTPHNWVDACDKLQGLGCFTGLWGFTQRWRTPHLTRRGSEVAVASTILEGVLLLGPVLYDMLVGSCSSPFISLPAPLTLPMQTFGPWWLVAVSQFPS
jgi:hypothetical protein